MVIWPWSRFQQYDRRLEMLTSDLLFANGELIGARHLAEITAINLRTAERDLERLGTEHNTLQADFKHLVAQTAGRVPSRHGQLNPDVFERDPFIENPKIPSEWLTDTGELPDIGALEEMISGQGGEDGERRGPSARQGAEGTAQ